MASRALVVLRLPRGAAAPAAEAVSSAIAADRERLHLAAKGQIDYRLAGPYPIEVGGRSLDEYVAWEI
jgi:hypothetical protein